MLYVKCKQFLRQSELMFQKFSRIPVTTTTALKENVLGNQVAKITDVAIILKFLVMSSNQFSFLQKGGKSLNIDQELCECWQDLATTQAKRSVHFNWQEAFCYYVGSQIDQKTLLLDTDIRTSYSYQFIRQFIKQFKTPP